MDLLLIPLSCHRCLHRVLYASTQLFPIRMSNQLAKQTSISPIFADEP